MIEWQERAIHQFNNSLRPEADAETMLVLLINWLHQARLEGLDEATRLLREIDKAKPGVAAKASFFADRINELRRMNARHICTSLDDHKS